jgi:misacylated tRNA(Ala) deacylase
MRTELLHQSDPYLQSCTAQVLSREERRIGLDRTVFYAAGGGQPGDVGTIAMPGGPRFRIEETVYAPDRMFVLHEIGEDSALLAPGEEVELTLDWTRRHRHMRMHTALHLLSTVLPYAVTGGQIGAEESRLDFDIPDAGLDKDEIAERIAAHVAADLPVTTEWITDEELDRNSGLVKTMSVKPPRGAGRVRLVRIGDIDLQPCGGTHVRSTGEIGRVEITKIEKKGRQNRRVRLRLVDEAGD